MKINKIIILGGFLFYYSALSIAEIKEVKTLEDFSNEIITSTGTKASTNKSTKNLKKEIESTKNNIIKKSENANILKSEKESEIQIEKEVNIGDIVDIFEKDMKNGLAYKKDENTPFTGLFGAVINGRIDHYESYKNGLLDGESAWYSKTGKKLLSEFYSKGKLNGEQKSYYENGRLKSVVKYLNGKIDGIKAYDNNGKVRHESIFKNGTGSWKFYWNNGSLFEEGEYVSWKKNGTWKRYREDGSLDIVRTYNNGRLLSESWE